MAGNVWEGTDSLGLMVRTRVWCGAGLGTSAMDSRPCADRNYYYPDYRIIFIGFRCVRT
jgi:formylglycine-generating enzyme required for sulfatase activity